MDFYSEYNYMYENNPKNKRKNKSMIFILLCFLIFGFFLLFLTLIGSIFIVKIEGDLITPGGLTDVSRIVSIEGKTYEDFEYKGIYVYKETAKLSLYDIIFKYRENKDGKEFIFAPSEELVNNNLERTYDTEEKESEYGALIFRESVKIATTIAYSLAAQVDDDIYISHNQEGALVVDYYSDNIDLSIGDVITHVNGEKIDYFNEYVNMQKSESCSQSAILDIKTKENVRKQVVTPYCQEDIEAYPYYEIADSIPEITFKSTDNIRGNSMGMMLTLGIYQALTNQLYEGKLIAGTGTIENDGSVDRIGGVYSKTMTAYQNGVKILLVSDDDLEEFLASAIALNIEDEMEIVGVNQIEDAIEFLTNYSDEEAGSVI